MKGRESGMPDETIWSGFFDVEATLAALMGRGVYDGNLVEFGCGYGTFTLSAARRTRGIVTALDIDSDMVALVRQRAAERGLDNVRAQLRDFLSSGTGLPDRSQRHAMIFNLLHIEEPVTLLSEALRTLQVGGTLAVIHWRSDIVTPRGPSLAIRPRPEQCRAWIKAAGFSHVRSVDLSHACPFHFGLVASTRSRGGG